MRTSNAGTRNHDALPVRVLSDCDRNRARKKTIFIPNHKITQCAEEYYVIIMSYRIDGGSGDGIRK